MECGLLPAVGVARDHSPPPVGGLASDAYVAILTRPAEHGSLCLGRSARGGTGVEGRGGVGWKGEGGKSGNCRCADCVTLDPRHRPRPFRLCTKAARLCLAQSSRWPCHLCLLGQLARNLPLVCRGPCWLGAAGWRRPGLRARRLWRSGPLAWLSSHSGVVPPGALWPGCASGLRCWRRKASAPPRHPVSHRFPPRTWKLVSRRWGDIGSACPSPP